MWLIDSKQGILTGCRIASTEIIEDSFQSIESLLENDTIEDWDFYESFVPFLKNFIAITEYSERKLLVPILTETKFCPISVSPRGVRL